MLEYSPIVLPDENETLYESKRGEDHSPQRLDMWVSVLRLTAQTAVRGQNCCRYSCILKAFMGDILAATREIGTVEDFSNRPINYPRRDFEDKWNHPRAKTKVEYSTKKADSALDLDENLVHDPTEGNMFVKGFFDLLDPTDVQIVSLVMEGFTHEQIAKKLGFKTHSAVTKRLHKLRPIFIKYSRNNT